MYLSLGLQINTVQSTLYMRYTSLSLLVEEIKILNVTLISTDPFFFYFTADQSLPSKVEIKNTWSYTSTPHTSS